MSHIVIRNEKYVSENFSACIVCIYLDFFRKHRQHITYTFILFLCVLKILDQIRKLEVQRLARVGEYMFEKCGVLICFNLDLSVLLRGF